MSGFPWIRFAIAAVGLTTFGYGLMRATVPTPEETYKALAPDLRRRVDARRAANRALEEAMTRQADAQKSPTKPEGELADPDAMKPIWAERK